MALNEDWKPEIEHIKGSDLLKKKKKKVEGLPPHLRLSAMKKAFAHTNEENALEKRAKENEKARKWLKKDAKKSGYTDIALRASMSKGAGVSEGVGDAVKKGLKRHKDAVEKKKIKNRKAVP